MLQVSLTKFGNDNTKLLPNINFKKPNGFINIYQVFEYCNFIKKFACNHISNSSQGHSKIMSLVGGSNFGDPEIILALPAKKKLLPQKLTNPPIVYLLFL